MSLKATILPALSAFALMTSATFAEPDQTAVRGSLIEFNDRFNALAASHDLEGLVAIYDEDAYWIAPNALPAKGRDGVPRQTITFLTKKKAELSHTIADLIISADGTQAVMMGVTSGAVKSAGMKFEGTYVYVLQREDENDPWKVVLDMFNNHPAK